jgi:hypothetical protein
MAANDSLLLEDGTVISGEAVALRNGLTGFAKVTVSDGSVFLGPLVACKRHGVGLFTLQNGTQYIGHFDNGRRHGFGTLYYSSSPDAQVPASFSGTWQADKRWGYGTAVYPSGNVYDGGWQNDAREGLGQMVWLDEREEYTGEWHAGQQHGWGIHTWFASAAHGAASRASLGQGTEGPCSSSEVRAFLLDQFRPPTAECISADDVASLLHPPVDQLRVQLSKYTSFLVISGRYKGQYNAGRREGFGVFEYSNGATFRGFWKADLKHGPGVFTAADGTVFAAQFVADNAISSDCSDQLVKSAFSASFKQLMGTALLSATESPQAMQQLLFQLRIDDLLPAGASALKVSLREVLNVLTRWNSQLRTWYKFYASQPAPQATRWFANATRHHEKDAYSWHSRVSERLYDVDAAAVHGAATMRLCHLWKFVQDCGLLLPGELHLADCGQMLSLIRAKQAAAAIRCIRNGTPASSGDESLRAEQPSEARDLLVQRILREFASQLYHAHDPTGPVLLREFVEVLIRIANRRLHATGKLAPYDDVGTMSTAVATLLGSGDIQLHKVGEAFAHALVVPTGDSSTVSGPPSRMPMSSAVSIRSGKMSARSNNNASASGMAFTSSNAVTNPPKFNAAPGTPEELASALHNMLWYRVAPHVSVHSAPSSAEDEDAQHLDSPYVDMLRDVSFWGCGAPAAEGPASAIAASFKHWLSRLPEALSTPSTLDSLSSLAEFLGSARVDEQQTYSGAIIAALGSHSASFMDFLASSPFESLDLYQPGPTSDADRVEHITHLPPPPSLQSVESLVHYLRRVGMIECRPAIHTVDSASTPVLVPASSQPQLTAAKSGKQGSRPPSTGIGASKGAAKAPASKSAHTASTSKMEAEEKSPLDVSKTFASVSAVVQQFRYACELEMARSPVLDDAVAAAVLLHTCSCLPINVEEGPITNHRRGSASSIALTGSALPLVSATSFTLLVESKEEESPPAALAPPQVVNILNVALPDLFAAPTFLVDEAKSKFGRASILVAPMMTEPSPRMEQSSKPASVTGSPKPASVVSSPVSSRPGELASALVLPDRPVLGRLSLPPQVVKLGSGSCELPIEDAKAQRLTIADVVEGLVRVTMAKGDILLHRHTWVAAAVSQLAIAGELAKQHAKVEVESWYKEVDHYMEAVSAELDKEKAKAGAAAAKKVDPKAAAASVADKAKKPGAKPVDGEDAAEPEAVKIAKADAEKAIDDIIKKTAVAIEKLQTFSPAAFPALTTPTVSSDAAEQPLLGTPVLEATTLLPPSGAFVPADYAVLAIETGWVSAFCVDSPTSPSYQAF